MSSAERRGFLDPASGLSQRRQCALLGVARSTLFYQGRGRRADDLAVARRLDELWMKYPFCGSRQLTAHLRRMGVTVGRHRVRRLMREMGIRALVPRPRTSVPHPDHRIHPYLLRGVTIDRPNQVWSADITCIPVRSGFFYLVAFMDWAARRVLSWRLSNAMDARLCLEAFDEALEQGRPEIVNTDQGSQFTSLAFTERVQAAGARCSMDDRGRFLDNVFIERLWHSLKYESVYLRELEDGYEAERVVGEWMRYYNHERPHSSLGGRTPAEACEGLILR